MPRIDGKVAEPSDDPQLRELMHDMPMPGDIQISYLREPSFFDALQVEGRYSEVIIGWDNENGRTVGIGSRSIKTAYLNGVPSGLGYLSSLRLRKEYRSGLNLARSYRGLRQLHQDEKTKLYITTIVEKNVIARMILTSGRCGLPAYHDYGQFYCAAISLHQKAKTACSDSLVIRPASVDDVPEIVEFLQREGSQKQFFPEYTAEDLLSSQGLLRGLELKNIFLAYSDGKLVGTTAVWDQRSFRQSRVIGYSTRLTILRLPYNWASGFLGYPILPRPGFNLDYFVLALVCIQENDPQIFSALFSEVLKLYRSRSVFLMAGLHKRDPLLSVLLQYRHISYPSRLYVACWEDGEVDFRNLDGRVPYLELGAL